MLKQQFQNGGMGRIVHRSSEDLGFWSYFRLAEWLREITHLCELHFPILWNGGHYDSLVYVKGNPSSSGLTD